MSYDICPVDANMTKEIEEILIKFDLPFVIKEPTKGDGNCFFRVIINQLQRNDVMVDIPPQMTSSHYILRNAIVDFVQYDYALSSSEEFYVAKVDYCTKYQFPCESLEGTWKRKLK